MIHVIVGAEKNIKDAIIQTKFPWVENIEVLEYLCDYY